MKKKIVTFELQDSELEDFERIFKEFGLRSRSEFIRMLLKVAMENYKK